MKKKILLAMFTIIAVGSLWARSLEQGSCTYTLSCGIKVIGPGGAYFEDTWEIIEFLSVLDHDGCPNGPWDHASYDCGPVQ